ncbi:MAG: hypothetical protein PHO48_02125 [Candidatus Gracilibacteria bacterium]|nr:hypothetical protein [Candidatus Gracilibacteria bacterium]MDD5178853.1 hypothetical protein [Candidatus Gracilibacteria bacterium]
MLEKPENLSPEEALQAKYAEALRLAQSDNELGVVLVQLTRDLIRELSNEIASAQERIAANSERGGFLVALNRHALQME